MKLPAGGPVIRLVAPAKGAPMEATAILPEVLVAGAASSKLAVVAEAGMQLREDRLLQIMVDKFMETKNSFRLPEDLVELAEIHRVSRSVQAKAAEAVARSDYSERLFLIS